jgi:hypothetical protein
MFDSGGPWLRIHITLMRTPDTSFIWFEPDPTLHFDVIRILLLTNLRPMLYRPYTALRLLNFDFDANSDPAVQNNAYLDPQPCCAFNTIQ